MFRGAALPTVAVMEHPNATFARNVYAALAAGDLATAFDALADDLVLINDVGAGPWRELRGTRVILAHARCTINAPSGPLAGEHASTATIVLLKRDERYEIAAFHNTLITG